jgi:hypothetical protein
MWYAKNRTLRVVGGGFTAMCLMVAWSLGNASEPSNRVQPFGQVESAGPCLHPGQMPLATDNAGPEMPWPIIGGEWPMAPMPEWTPFWQPKHPVPAIGPIPFVMPELKPAPIDPGSLRVEETMHGSDETGRYMVRRRTWTSGGASCHEVTVVSPPPTVADCDANTGAVDADAKEPEDGEAAAGENQADESPRTDHRAPAESSKDSAAKPRQAVSVGVAVSADSGKGVRIQHYIEGDTAHEAHGWSAVSVGASADSQRGVRIYRYHGGPAPRPTER